MICNYCKKPYLTKRGFRPHAIEVNVKTGVIIRLCLKACRWFPDAYPDNPPRKDFKTVEDWQDALSKHSKNWVEIIVNPKPYKPKRKRWAGGNDWRKNES